MPLSGLSCQGLAVLRLERRYLLYRSGKAVARLARNRMTSKGAASGASLDASCQRRILAGSKQSWLLRRGCVRWQDRSGHRDAQDLLHFDAFLRVSGCQLTLTFEQQGRLSTSYAQDSVQLGSTGSVFFAKVLEHGQADVYHFLGAFAYCCQFW